MNLKILLPFRVFAEIEDVLQIVMETKDGAYGLLPQRLDCVAALSPGIFMYETKSAGVCYLAIDEGVVVKAGAQVLVSVRNAIGGTDLDNLHASVEKEFANLDESEKTTRAIIAKMESGFMYHLEKFRKE